MRILRFVPWALPLLLVWAGVDRATGPDGTVSPDEATLIKAGLQTDDASLLEFFRQRTLSDRDQARLAGLIRQLGERQFRKRERASAELRLAGRAALPCLRAALKDPDLEISRRAGQCLRAIASGSEAERVLAAGRLLAARQTAGGAAAILNYLPFSDDTAIEDELITSLRSVAWRGGRADPAVVAALHDPRAIKRSAAALALGSGKDPALRAAVRPLLDDSDTLVRLRAAEGLLEGRDKQAVPTLIRLLAEAPAAQAWQAEDLLTSLAGDQAPFVSLAEAGSETSRKASAAWADWWQKHENTIDLAKLAAEPHDLGLTLIVAIDGYEGTGQIWEVGRDGKPRWKLTQVQRPMDARLLPGNRILVAEYGGRRITIRDRNTGKIDKEYPVNGNPSDVQRLANGNIFYSTWPNGVAEITPEGKQVYAHSSSQGSITSAKRLRNGHVVYVTQTGNLVEIDEKGTQLNQIHFTETPGWRLGLDVLPGPRYLVGFQGANKVVEYDVKGKPLWEYSIQSPTQVTRLRNGHTLICANDNRVVEVNRAGKVVWEQHLQGRPFRARRR